MNQNVGFAVAAGLAVVLIACALVLTKSATREAGTNYVAVSGPVRTLAPGGEHCQGQELVPKDAGGLQLIVSGKPVPALRVTATSATGAVTEGSLPAGRPQGAVVVPVRRVARSSPSALVCITAGRSGRIVLHGTEGRVRLVWLRSGRESWLAVAPAVAHRVALGRANLLGSLLLPALVLLALAAMGLAAALLIRESRP